MRREKHVIIEDINSIDEVEHIVLESDVFINDDEDDKTVHTGCCCFKPIIINYWLNFLKHYLD